MENIIKNSCWEPGANGGPQYFSAIGPITFDNFCINGYRTSSITQVTDCPLKARDSYDLPIPVCGQKNIKWGFCIRAIEAQEIALVAKFYDQQGCLLQRCRQNVADVVDYQFKKVMARFPIPCNTCWIKLAIEFVGNIIACTYYAPSAYWC